MIEELSVVLMVKDVYVIVTVVSLDVPVAELVLVLVLFNRFWALYRDFSFFFKASVPVLHLATNVRDLSSFLLQPIVAFLHLFHSPFTFESLSLTAKL